MAQYFNRLDNTEFSSAQYVFYMLVGVLIWFLGVIIVRVAGDTVFTAGNPLLPVFYFVSIPLGIVTMFVVQFVCRIPMKETLTPVLVMLFTTLSLDGFAVGFTDWYGATDEIVRHASGFLLWTFGIQVLVTMWMVGRAKRADGI